MCAHRRRKIEVPTGFGEQTFPFAILTMTFKHGDFAVTTRPENAPAPSATDSRDLPSGRSVVVRLNGPQEELEVRSPTGEVEVRIVLTDAGPLVQLRGARLELVSPESIDVNSKRFTVRTTEGTTLESEGDINVKALGDVDVQGKLVKLNC
jgi:hypothetical protein